MNTNSQDARPTRRSTGWAGAAVLLVIAAALFADQLGMQIPGSFWGLLLAVPAVGAAFACVRSAKLEGATSSTIFQGLLSAAFVAMGVSIVFGLDIGLLWPILLVVIAVLIIARAATKSE